MATTEETKPTFEDWTNRLKVYNDYIKALAAYKQASAEEAMGYAEAAGQWEKARALRFALIQLARDFADLRKMTERNRQEVAKMKEREGRAMILLRGRATNLWTQGWAAYLWFQNRALLESSVDLYSITAPTGGREATKFVHQRGIQFPCQPLPKEINTALAMMSWLQENRQLPRIGSEPHQAMVEIFRAINGVVAASIAQMQEAITAMRKGTFEAWKPTALFGIAEPAKRARIEWAVSPVSPSKLGKHPGDRPSGRVR